MVPGIGLGWTEAAIIGLIGVVIFGARRLPEIGSGLGKAIKGFRAGLGGAEPEELPEKREVSEGEPQ
ncbi:MAG: twin-arginine translocase TatA/TatE family subunit [Deltaproteobacteria bacterium]|nr:twin-arginine translocase TatA/TatE family subunit [Deltaproteobacteria bacterium]MDD9853546.1 twin-arginine translocase TatA/TatE family subunit [Deltaproteobacteria bacterium]MDD9873074.1 twin-arginine translocase TatA/TatE family subunit [Deltaproteobacteria bacterium]